MTAKLVLELDNKTNQGLQEITRHIDQAGAASLRTTSKFDALNKEMESREAAKFAKEVKELADELDGTAEAARKAAKAQEEFNKTQKDLADSKKNWMDIAAKASLVRGAIHSIVEVGKKAGEAIHFMAEQGVESMQRLETAGGKLRSAIVRTFDTKPVTVFADAVSDMVTDSSIKLDYLSGQANGLFDAMGRLAGFDVDQANAARQKSTDAAQRKKFATEEAAQQQQQIRAAGDLWLDLDTKQRQAVESRRLAEVQGVANLEKELKAAKERFDDRRKEAIGADKAKHEKAMQAAREEEQLILSLEQRIHDTKKTLREEEAAARRALWQQELERIEIKRQKAIQAEKDIAQAVIDGERAKFAAEEARRMAEAAAQQAKVDDLKKFLTGGMQQAFGGGMPMMGQGGGFNPMLGGQAPMGGPAFAPPPGMMGGGQNADPTHGVFPAGWKGVRGRGVDVIRGVEGNDIVNGLGGGITQREINERVRRKRLESEKQQFIDEERKAGRMDQNGNPLTDEQILRANMGPDQGRRGNKNFQEGKRLPQGFELVTDVGGPAEFIALPGKDNTMLRKRKRMPDQLSDTETGQELLQKLAEEQRQRMKEQKEAADEEAEYGPMHPETFPEFHKKREEQSKRVAAEKKAAEEKLKQTKKERQQLDEENAKKEEMRREQRKDPKLAKMQDEAEREQRLFEQFRKENPEGMGAEFEDWKADRQKQQADDIAAKRNAAGKNQQARKAAQAASDARLDKRTRGVNSRFNKDARGSKGAGIPLDEQADAWGDAMNENINLLRGTGKVNDVTLKAAEQMVDNQKRLAKKQTEMMEDWKDLMSGIAEVRQILNQGMSRGMNSNNRTRQTGLAR